MVACGERQPYSYDAGLLPPSPHHTRPLTPWTRYLRSTYYSHHLADGMLPDGLTGRRVWCVVIAGTGWHVQVRKACWVTDGRYLW